MSLPETDQRTTWAGGSAAAAPAAWGRLARWTGRPWFWLALAALVYTPLISTEANPGNVASDLAAIESLVERGTFAIDDSTFIGTIDKFYSGGHFYSQKPPIFHLAGAVVYAAARTAGWALTGQPTVCIRILTFIMVILPMGWLLWLVYDHPWLRRRAAEWNGNRARLALAGFFAAGSLMTPFAITLNHYILAAACLMMAVRKLTAENMLRWPMATDTQPKAAVPQNTRKDWRLGLAMGGWLGASLACDVPAAFLFGAGLSCAWGLSWLGFGWGSMEQQGSRQQAGRRLAGLAVGILPLLLIYGALNLKITGSPLPINTFSLEAFEFEGSYWAEVRARAEAGRPGYYQASYPRRLFHALVGHKGIYWMMPLLVVATAAAWWLARRRRPGWELAVAWAFFLPLLIALAMRWAFDLSGGAYLIRHGLAAVAPLFCVLGHPDLPRPNRAAVRAGLVTAGVWGCLVAGIGLINPWSHNTLSAWPPLENVARVCLKHYDRLPTGWIEELVRRTSVEPATGWLDLGMARFSAVDPQRAEAAFKRAIAVDPEAKLAYYHLGMLQDLTRRPNAAIETYQRLLKMEPENVGAWNNLGVAALHAGWLDLAEKAYQESLRLAPENYSGMVGMLNIEEAKGLKEAHAARLKRAMELYPTDARLRRIQEKGNK